MFAAFKQGRWALVAEGLRRGRMILLSMWWKVLLGVIQGLITIEIPI
jgi:hypothetical protein